MLFSRRRPSGVVERSIRSLSVGVVALAQPRPILGRMLTLINCFLAAEPVASRLASRMADQNIPRRQHTVSQGILRRFTEPTTGQLESYNLIHGKAHRKYPVQVGFVWNFVEHEPTATEKRWQGTEVRLPS